VQTVSIDEGIGTIVAPKHRKAVVLGKRLRNKFLRRYRQCSITKDKALMLCVLIYPVRSIILWPKVIANLKFFGVKIKT